MATCFRLDGYPNWYKNLKAQKAQIFRRPNAANITHDTPLDNEEHIEPGYENNQPGNIDWTEIIQKEVAKYLKDKIPFSHVNFAQSEYAGMPSHISLTSHATTALGRGVWIIDTGASTHMSNTFDFLDQPEPIHPLLPVYLPDGTSQFVSHSGSIHLHPKLLLTDVLFLSSFQYNLISVSKLSASANIWFIFSSSSCHLQDLRTESCCEACWFSLHFG